MKTCLPLACASLLAALAVAAGCSPAASSKADGTNPAPSPTADGGTMPGVDGGGSTPDGTAPGAAATSCSTGALFAGNPVYDGAPLDRPASGTGIHADPPLQWQNLVFSGKQLYTRDTGEVWGTDLSAASPVETRIAGQNQASTFPYTSGPCATARMGKIEGVAAMPDGSLLAADVLGNGVLHITNPTNAATCKVDYYAGNAVASDDINPNNPSPNTGDVDGAGATAKFDGPGAIVVDDAGNAFVFDRGNKKVKKIGNDAAHTVKTLATLGADGPDQLTNMTRIGSTLYGVGTNGVEAIVVAIDTTTGTVTNVVKGRGDTFPPLDSTTFPAIAGITTDGQGLMIAGQGYVWYVTTKGVVTNLAGSGLHIDFPENGYDPKVSHPAAMLQLTPSANGSLIGSSDYITYFQGGLYYRGHHQGTAAYVERIACP